MKLVHKHIRQSVSKSLLIIGLLLPHSSNCATDTATNNTHISIKHAHEQPIKTSSISQKIKNYTQSTYSAFKKHSATIACAVATSGALAWYFLKKDASEETENNVENRDSQSDVTHKNRSHATSAHKKSVHQKTKRTPKQTPVYAADAASSASSTNIAAITSPYSTRQTSLNTAHNAPQSARTDKKQPDQNKKTLKAPASKEQKAENQSQFSAAIIANKDIAHLKKIIFDTDGNLKEGIDINARIGFFKDKIALILATQHNNTQVVELLLSLNADITAIDSAFHGYTALHLAIIEGNVDMVRLLVHKKADVKAQSQKKETPLTCLINNKRDLTPDAQIKIADILLSADNTQITIDHILSALRQPHVDPVNPDYTFTTHLIRKCPTQELGKKKRDHLHDQSVWDFVALDSNPQIAAHIAPLLIERNIPNPIANDYGRLTKDKKNQKLLEFAAAGNCQEAAALIATGNVDINCVSGPELTLKLGAYTLIPGYQHKPSDYCSAPSTNKTPLSIAITMGHTHMVRLLLGLKDIDLAKKTGTNLSSSYIDLAVTVGAQEIVELLLNHTTVAENTDYEKALSTVKVFGTHWKPEKYQAIKTALETAQTKCKALPSKPLIDVPVTDAPADTPQQPKPVESRYDKYKKLTSQEKNKKLIELTELGSGFEACVADLLKASHDDESNKVNVNCSGSFSYPQDRHHHRTPLAHAISNKNVEMVRQLLAHDDIDIEITTHDTLEYTYLTHAINAGNADIVQLLLDYKHAKNNKTVNIYPHRKNYLIDAITCKMDHHQKIRIIQLLLTKDAENRKLGNVPGARPEDTPLVNLYRYNLLWRTPLMEAAIIPEPDIVQVLLAHGARLTDDEGKEMETGMNHGTILKQVIRKKRNDTPVEKVQKTVQLLIHAKASIDSDYVKKSQLWTVPGYEKDPIWSDKDYQKIIATVEAAQEQQKSANGQQSIDD